MTYSLPQPVPTCATCASCIGAEKNLFSGQCMAVPDPYTGDPQPVKLARLDNNGGLKQPCGYDGRLWTAKT